MKTRKIPPKDRPMVWRRSFCSRRQFRGLGRRTEIVKVGDRVLFGKWADVLIDGEDRLILKDSDILGVIEGKMRAKAKAA